MKKELLVKLSSLQTGQSFQFVTPEIGQEGEFTELDLKVWIVLHHTPNTTIYTSREGGFHLTPKTRSVEFIDMSKYRTDLVDEALQLMIRVYNRNINSTISSVIEHILRRSPESDLSQFLIELHQQLTQDAIDSTQRYLGEDLSSDLIQWVQEYQKDKK